MTDLAFCEITDLFQLIELEELNMRLLSSIQLNFLLAALFLNFYVAVSDLLVIVIFKILLWPFTYCCSKTNAVVAKQT